MKSNKGSQVQVKFQHDNEVVRYVFPPDEYVEVDEEHVDYLPSGFQRKPGPRKEKNKSDTDSENRLDSSTDGE